jgi:hypothetical protein
MLGLLFGCGAGSLGAGPTARASRIIENPDSTRTFVDPEISTEDGRFRIGQGVAGACRLFGMDGLLSGYVVWSAVLAASVEVRDDGSIGEPAPGTYVESMTCTSGASYRPKLVSSDTRRNPDGSVTITTPAVHTGTDRLPVLSGHLGACRLAGYREVVADTLAWSTARAEGISLAADGKIYQRGAGTYMTSLGCRDSDDDE